MIEVKAKDTIDERDAKALNCFADEFGNPDCYLFSLDTTRHQIGEVECCFWREGLESIFEM